MSKSVSSIIIGKEVVVARFREDPELWIRGFEGSDVGLTIYNKGDRDPRFASLPNVGREAQTWLHHIIVRYNNLADLTAFAQGDPSPHYPQFIDVLRKLKPPYLAFAELSNVIYEITGDPIYFHDRSYIQTPDYCGVQHENEVWSLLFNVPPPKPTFRSPCGGQFMATRDSIRRLPRSFWERALRLSIERPLGPWEMEPLWNYIFTRPLSDFRLELLEQNKYENSLVVVQ